MQNPATLVEGIRAGIENMPFNRHLGLRVAVVATGRARGTLERRAEVANHVGSVHVGAQFALVEAAAGAAVTSALLDVLSQVVPLAKGIDIRYRRAAVGEVFADAIVLPADAHRVRQALLTLGAAAELDVQVTVTDGQGTPAVDATSHWVVRRR